MTEQSALIVLGEIVSVQRGVRASTVEVNNRTVSARVDQAVFRTDQVLKGSPPSVSFTFEFLTPDESLGWRIPPEGAYGIYFFRGDRETLQFTSVYEPGIPVPQGIGVRGETALDRVVNTLGAVVSMQGGSMESKTQAVWYLTFSKSAASTQVLRSVLDDPDPELRVSAVLALILRDDGSALRVVKAMFMEDMQGLPPRTVEGIGNAIGGHFSDSALIPDLQELLRSTSVHIRRGAASAIWHSGASGAEKALLGILEDPDFEVRYYGVIGLADAFGNKDWLPSREEFKAQETKYLSYWKDRASRFQ
jgi:hypothetical protein